MPVIDKKTGNVSYRALTEAEKTQINDLAMQAMGFNRERGDSLTIVNTPFAGEPEQVLPAIPLWENPRVIENAKDVLRFLVSVIALWIIYRKALKPLLNKLTIPTTRADNQNEAPDTVVNISEDDSVSISKPAYEQKIETAKQLAKDNPRMVASVVANWTNGNE
jgi:flagellar M-ring protein FliF